MMSLFMQVNPFKDRICKVFSSSNDGELTFEDFLDMMSVFSENVSLQTYLECKQFYFVTNCTSFVSLWFLFFMYLFDKILLKLNSLNTQLCMLNCVC